MCHIGLKSGEFGSIDANSSALLVDSVQLPFYDDIVYKRSSEPVSVSRLFNLEIGNVHLVILLS